MRTISQNTNSLLLDNAQAAAAADEEDAPGTDNEVEPPPMGVDDALLDEPDGLGDDKSSG